MISANGRYVAFSSIINHVVNGYLYPQWDVFVYDLQTGATEQVSVTPDGSRGNDNSGQVNPAHVSLYGSGRASLSPDGRYVAFTSYASNLVAGDTNGALDVFVRDRQTGVTERISVASDGTQADQNCFDASISADGRYVAFTSHATNLVAGDTNGLPDVFVHDRQSGGTTRVSVGPGGIQLNQLSIQPSLSADGRYVSFSSAANVVPSDPSGYAGVFVYDRQTGTAVRVSVAADGSQANHASGAFAQPGYGGGGGGASISGDGRYVAFMSYATNLVPGGTQTTRGVYLATVNGTGPTAAPAVSVTGFSGTYDGQSHGAATASVTGSGGETLPFTLTYYAGADASGPPLPGAPVGAGTYTVVAAFAGNSDYLPASASAAITIARASPTVSVTGGSFIYNGQPRPATGLSVTGVGGEDLGTPTVTYYYRDENGIWQLTDGGGSEVPLAPGYYKAVASYAGNDDYQPATQEALITIAAPVGYDFQVLTDLGKAFKAGRAIPIKIMLLDANGNNISSSDVDLTAIRLERVNADSTRTTVALADTGNANPGNLFRYDAALGGYIFNLSTKGLTAGTYDFFWMAEGDSTEHKLEFRLI